MGLSEESRIWVYQSDKEISPEQQEKMLVRLNAFCSEWTAHNQQLLADVEIRYNRFIILMIDESMTNASGCSIDKSVQFLQEIEKEFNLELFNRMHFAYKDKQDKVQVLSREDFEEAIKNKAITKETIVFNNLVNTKKELDHAWEIALEKSWHANFFAVPL